MDDGFKRPIVTIDVVLMTIKDEQLSVALMKRPNEPFAGSEALVGGYVHVNEDRDAEDAARRILRTKTGLEHIYLEQLRTFASRDRDPRDWSVSIAYFALVPYEVLMEHSGMQLILRPSDNPGNLPFDHAQIVASAQERLRGKGAYSTIAACLLPDHFTMPELLRIYQIVIDDKLDQSAFRRKVNALDLLEEVGKTEANSQARRPTTLYRLKAAPAVFLGRIKAGSARH
ncbi:NUDIX hydrolase [Mesorhizobium sp. B2-4-13]|uniref:NUDIX hydrolase n=1 Tax=Mesorhizobium sp. B2-4-13 TaxID=2589936 RepID=UPI001154DC8B|nr:NUDIX domain-containing protein [Mesorhizobium sp. B2-4-13]TPK85723.1 NUDIX hydrolase [Mesorhizobium sp. B2-4-13]